MRSLSLFGGVLVASVLACGNDPDTVVAGADGALYSTRRLCADENRILIARSDSGNSTIVPIETRPPPSCTVLFLSIPDAQDGDELTVDLDTANPVAFQQSDFACPALFDELIPDDVPTTSDARGSVRLSARPLAVSVEATVEIVDPPVAFSVDLVRLRDPANCPVTEDDAP